MPGARIEITKLRRSYQQLVADLKEHIEQGVYLVGDKLPVERFITDEEDTSCTVVREAIVMLEVEDYVEVRKGSGIHVVSNQPRHQQTADNNMELVNYGPFESPQTRQLIESNIVEFATTQVTKQDIMRSMVIQERARGEQYFRGSEWDLRFHIQVALATQNFALAATVEKIWAQRSHNPYWKELHKHIDAHIVGNWCDGHDQILKAPIHKDPHAARLAMWQRLKNTRIMLFNETSDDFEFNADRYLFAKNPVMYFDTATSGSRRGSCPTGATVRLLVSSVSEEYKMPACVNPLTSLPCIQ